jgi:hypothetical protein
MFGVDTAATASHCRRASRGVRVLLGAELGRGDARGKELILGWRLQGLSGGAGRVRLEGVEVSGCLAADIARVLGWHNAVTHRDLIGND